MKQVSYHTGGGLEWFTLFVFDVKGAYSKRALERNKVPIQKRARTKERAFQTTKA